MEPEPKQIFTAHSWLRTAAKVFVIGAVALLLYVAHAAFIPIALALLLALILSGPVEALHKRRIPRSLSSAVILMIALSAIGGAVALMWTPTQEWLARAPQTMATIRKKVRPVAMFMTHLDELRKSASNIGRKPAAPAPAPATAIGGAAWESAPAVIFNVSAPIIAGSLAFVIVTLFLLTGGPPMLARMTAAFVEDLKSSRVLEMIEKVRAEVGHFYLTTTLINVGLGTATALAMWAWGMPTPYVWGGLAAIVNYVPYAGAATTLVVVTLVAFVSFNSLGQVLGVAGTYLLLATIEGQVVQPLLVGRRLAVNPLLIFLGLWLGALFWGIAGVVLSTPALVALKVIAENSKSGKSMLEFLGPNDQSPNRDARLYRIARRGSSAADRQLPTEGRSRPQEGN